MPREERKMIGVTPEFHARLKARADKNHRTILGELEMLLDILESATAELSSKL